MSSYVFSVENGPLQGEKYALVKDVCTVGRDAGSDLAINDTTVSRHHARIVRQSGEIIVEDMGSLNGTMVNGNLITAPTLLTPGDVVRFGLHITLRFSLMNEASRPAPPAARKKSDTRRIHKAGPAPFSLVIRGGRQAGQVFPLIEGEHGIGRAGDNPILLTNDDVSSHHAVVRVEADGVSIMDLDSANGTYVNNTAVNGVARIKPGDMLQIGASVVVEVHAGVAVRA
ncbi:MAG: FHA domain-containing protein [Chloroflexi bacterium]|nr:FHA domain-containing protein [Chloroflexota bacterium]